MIKTTIKTLLLLLVINSQPLLADNIGLLITATGKYIQYVDPLIESAEKHFCKEHKVTYFIFTDSNLPSTENTIYLPHNRLGWPFDTMMRFEAYLNERDLLEQQDYLFCCDADMLFVGEVGSEILSDLVATQHPGFVSKRGSYETDPRSTACINDHEGEIYFAGGFYGGNSTCVMDLCQTNVEHIHQDLSQGIIAVWHDESHLNRYFVDNLPTKILNPSYCYPESWDLPYAKKLLALDKNHSEMRE